MPFGDGTFDVVFSAFGALQFVADADALVADVARVLEARRGVRLLDHAPDTVDVPR